MPENKMIIDACPTLCRIAGRLEGTATALSMINQAKEVTSLLRDASLTIMEILDTHQIIPFK